MRATRVVVADDNDAMRQALVEVLHAAGGFEVVAELPDGHGLVEAVRSTAADLVLLDVGMEAGGQVGATALHAVSPPPSSSSSAPPTTTRRSPGCSRPG